MGASARPNINRRQYLALALGSIAFALCFAAWGLISPLVPHFQETFGLSATEASVLVAIPVLLGSLGRIPAGMLADRFGGRLVFSLLLLFLVIPLALIGFANSYWTLVLGGFWLGMAGASFAVGVPFVSRWFAPSTQGFVLGIYGMGNIGTAIANFIAPPVAAVYGWQAVFQLATIPTAAMAGVFWLAAREAPVAPPPGRSTGDFIRLVQTRPLALVLSLFYFVTFGGFVAISLYLPTFLVTTFALEEADAALRAAGFVVLATLARPIGGYLSDHINAATLLNGVFAAITLLGIALAFPLNMAALSIAFLGCGIVLGLGNGAVFKLVAQLFPKETGAVTGIVGAAGGLGGFFPPIVMGLVRDVTGHYEIGFMLLSEFALLCLLVNLLLLGSRSRSPGENGSR